MTEIIVAFVVFVILALFGLSFSREISSCSTERILASIYFILFMILSMLTILTINVLKYIHV